MQLSRSNHANIVINQAKRWQAFEKLHSDAFTGDKYIAVDAKGERMGAFATNSLAAQVTNAKTVRHEDFLTIREEIIGIRRRRLNGIADLMSAGLTFPEDISKTLVGFENHSEGADARQDMNPNVTANDDIVFNEQFTPLPITHKGFGVAFRQGSFDYKRSMNMSESIRKVAERLEKTLFLGNSKIVVNHDSVNHPLYGYTNHPNRGTATISNWALTASTGVIATELNREVGLMWSGQGGVGPDSLVVYVANDIYQNLQNDNKAESDLTVMERCLRIPQVREIKAAEYLANGDVVIVEMEPRTIQMAVASDIIAVPHVKTEVFEDQAYTVYAAMTHCIKSDTNNNTGLRHLSKS